MSVSSPGQKIALVGASGGGKSTLVQILLGMYPIREGSVHYDGVPVEEIGLILSGKCCHSVTAANAV